MSPRTLLALLFLDALAATACSPAHGGEEGGAAKHAQLVAPTSAGAAPTVVLSAEAAGRIGVELAPVERRALPRTVTVPGACAVAPGRRVSITAAFTGQLRALESSPWRAGARVEAGAALAELAPVVSPEREVLSSAERVQTERTELDLQLSRADAEGRLATARARLEVARLAVTRAEALVADDAGSRRALDEARAEEAYAEAAQQSAEAAVNALASASEEPQSGAPEVLRLAAPFAGTLTALSAAPGQLVAAGAPLCELAQLDPLWVRADLRDDELARVDRAAEARVAGLGAPPGAPDAAARPIEGPPAADPLAATVALWFELDDPDQRWQPGQRVALTLALEGEREVSVVPRGAVLYDAQGAAWVYVAAGERSYRRARVELARVVGELAVLERGPAVGAEVVTAGAAELYGVEYEGGS